MQVFTDEYKQAVKGRLHEQWNSSKTTKGARMATFQVVIGPLFLISIAVTGIFVKLYHQNPPDWVYFIFFAWGVGIAIWLYMIPGFVAWVRYHNNGLAICWLNILLGWSVIGWIFALIWACTKDVNRDPAARMEM